MISAGTDASEMHNGLHHLLMMVQLHCHVKVGVDYHLEEELCLDHHSEVEHHSREELLALLSYL